MATDPKKLSDRECELLYARARMAGLAAAEAAEVAPMVVQQHADVLDDNSPVTQSWFVPDGPCGFAWVRFSPANQRFANWMGKRGLARRGSYWISEFEQSMQRKAAYARAFAEVVVAAGVKAYSESRMD